MSLLPWSWDFVAENQRSFNFWEIRKPDEGEEFFLKSLQSLKKLTYQNWRTVRRSVVALFNGRINNKAFVSVGISMGQLLLILIDSHSQFPPKLQAFLLNQSHNQQPSLSTYSSNNCMCDLLLWMGTLLSQTHIASHFGPFSYLQNHFFSKSNGCVSSSTKISTGSFQLVHLKKNYLLSNENSTFCLLLGISDRPMTQKKAISNVL